MSKIDLVVRISSGNACQKVGAASAKERSTKVTKVLILGRWRSNSELYLKL